jgi:hypothetical protein
MRKTPRHALAGTLAAALLVVGIAVTALAADNSGKTEKSEKSGETAKSMTVMGTIIDTKCYASDHNNIGNDHGGMKGCGSICARGGIPVGILVDGKKDGKVLVLLAPSKAFADYIGMGARVTGSAALGPNTLLPEKVEVKQADGTYKEIDFSSMM